MYKINLYFILFIFYFLPFAMFGGEYIVKSGDNLKKIAQTTLGDSNQWEALAKLNNLTAPYRLSVGQIIILPSVSISKVDKEPLLKGNANSSSSFVTFAILAVLAFLFFSVMSLKLGCWLSLVEVSLFKCTVFSIVSILTTLLCAIGCVFLAFQTLTMNSSIIVSCFVLLISIYIGINIVFLKKYFDCKWRSTLTITVMTSISSHFLTVAFVLVISVIVPKIFVLGDALAFIKNLVSQYFPNG